MAISLALLPMVAVGLLVVAVRQDIGLLFIGDAAIVMKVAAVAPVCAAYLVVDAVGGAASGVLR